MSVKPVPQKPTDGPPKPPVGLGARGSATWAEIHTTFEFDPQETELLIEVCRTLDTIDELSKAIDRDGYMLQGSTGQPVLNPAIAELRQQQLSYSRLVTMLNLQGVEGAAAIIRATSVRASTAANARWQKSNRAKNA
jgi:hypothetical protein